MATNYMMNLKITNFLGSKIISVENADGVEEKGVFIPLDMNDLKVTDKGHVYVNAFVTEKMTNTRDDNSHYIKQKVSKAHVNYIKDLGYETPYLGSLRQSNYRY